MGSKMGVCSASSNNHYMRHHDGEHTYNTNQAQRFEEINDYRDGLIRAFVFEIQVTLYTLYVNTNFESFSIIPYKIHDIIGIYLPLFQIYGIGKGILNSDDTLNEFVRLTQFESLLSHKKHIYKSRNRFFIKSCFNELFVIGHYHSDDTKFTKHFNDAHYDNNNNSKDGTFLNHFKKLHTFSDIEFVSSGLYASNIAIKLKNGKIYLSQNKKSITMMNCREIILTNIYQISCGKSHSLFLSTNGIVYSMGNNDNGQCGIKSTVNNKINALYLQYPRAINYFIKKNIWIKSISSGIHHNCCVDKHHKVYCFGSNNYNECTFGGSSLFNIDKPYKFKYFCKKYKIVKAKCGRETTVCLTSKGYCFIFGRLQNEIPVTDEIVTDKECLKNALLFEDYSQFRDFNVGYNHIIFITLDNTIMAYGYNKYNQCGTEYLTSAEEDVEINKYKKMTRILTNDMFPDLQSPAKIHHVIAGLENTIIVFR